MLTLHSKNLERTAKQARESSFKKEKKKQKLGVNNDKVEINKFIKQIAEYNKAIFVKVTKEQATT